MQKTNIFDLPELKKSSNGAVLSMPDTAIGRLDFLNAQIGASSLERILCECQANLELLYIKAKNFHWNVKGTGFQGVHEMFDQLQEFAVESADRVAERMRFHDFTVNATARDYLGCAWFPEGNPNLSMNGMLADMVMTLQCIIEHLDTFIGETDSTPVDQNMLQDISETLGKYTYFARSNMCAEETTTTF